MTVPQILDAEGWKLGEFSIHLIWLIRAKPAPHWVTEHQEAVMLSALRALADRPLGKLLRDACLDSQLYILHLLGDKQAAAEMQWLVRQRENAAASGVEAESTRIETEALRITCRLRLLEYAWRHKRGIA